MEVFSKILTKTDIGKRLAVPSQRKKCFLSFTGQQHRIEFEVVDEDGGVWVFVCSTRKLGRFPKPVLTKGWLQFARWWKLAVGDEVILHSKVRGQYRIEIKRATQLSYNDPDRALGVASYVEEEEPTLTTCNSREQAITYDQNEGLLESEAVDLQQHSKPKLIDFFKLESEARQVNKPKFIDFFKKKLGPVLNF
ncbi:hypothetical protein PTKIN_Ptkin10aG0186900 [Pterospermum kingtungense]